MALTSLFSKTPETFRARKAKFKTLAAKKSIPRIETLHKCKLCLNVESSALHIKRFMVFEMPFSVPKPFRDLRETVPWKLSSKGRGGGEK